MAGRDRGAECDLPGIPTEGKVDAGRRRARGRISPFPIVSRVHFPLISFFAERSARARGWGQGLGDEVTQHRSGGDELNTWDQNKQNVL